MSSWTNRKRDTVATTTAPGLAPILSGDEYQYLNGDGNYAFLVVENRTSDPSSPAVGRIWLRTDL